jgi:hypothetical protein
MAPNIKKLTILLLGLSVITFTLWKLFRTRLPKDIPLTLSATSFFIYSIIIITLIIIMITIIINMFVQDKKATNVIYAELTNTFYMMPLITVDTFFKSFSRIENLFDRYRYEVIEFLNIAHYRIIFLYFFSILPKIILASTFAIDIFYYHKLEYFYFIAL